MELTQAFFRDESSALRVSTEFLKRWPYDPYKCNNEGRNAEGLAYKLGLHGVKRLYAELRESLRSVRILGDVDANERRMEAIITTGDVLEVIRLLKVIDPRRIRFQGTGNTFLMEIIERFPENEVIPIVRAYFRRDSYNPYMYSNNRENAKRVALRMGFDFVIQLLAENIQRERPVWKPVCLHKEVIEREFIWSLLVAGEEIVKMGKAEGEVNDVIGEIIEAVKLDRIKGGGNFPIDGFTRNKTGQTALAFAVLAGNLPLVRLLISAGASVDVPNSQGELSINIALRIVHREERRKKSENAARLFEYGSIAAALNIRSSEEKLWEAIIDENLDKVRNVL